MIYSKWLSIASAISLAGCISSGVMPPWLDPQLRQFVTPSLQHFESRAAFDRYLARLHSVAERRGAWWVAVQQPQFDQLLASTSSAPAECDPSIIDCILLEEVVVTARSASAPTPSITNNQELAVDEGDIVKAFGRYLIVLQDGRLFSVDTGSSPTEMALVDRINIYPEPDRGTWYDELLIHENTIVVVGFSYELDASEIVVFQIDGAGVFEYQMTYFISSNDYYSQENYASRLVDGHLVFYTPLHVTETRYPDDPVTFPQVRRWTPDSGYSDWRPLYVAEDLYQPILRTLDPVVHTVSVCPIEHAEEWDCRSTGFVGPWFRELYVTADYAYLWNTTDLYEWYDYDLADYCPEDLYQRDFEATPAALYRVPLFEGAATALLTSGIPTDQFSLDARDNEFLALLHWVPGHCVQDDDLFPLKFASFSLGDFSVTPQDVDSNVYVAVPTAAGDGFLENRFAENYLVYSSSHGRWSANRPAADFSSTEVIVVPISDPEMPIVLPLLHSAERIEVFGENVVIDGYQRNTGLTVSTLDLRGQPKIADQEYLDSVLESEGRSHAFNYVVEADGSGVFGLPTVFRNGPDDRYWDRPSDVSFFSVEPTLDIQPSGNLAASQDAQSPTYECEVSCVDWYGSARPIFFRDRIFGLTGPELIEGHLQAGVITEIARVNLTGIPLHTR